jgi:hypothetical protein
MGTPQRTLRQASTRTTPSWGYEYKFYAIGKAALPARAVSIKSPVRFDGRVLAYVGQNFYDWLGSGDDAVRASLRGLRADGFLGVQVDLNYYMSSPTADSVWPQYAVDESVCPAWARTPTHDETRRLLRLASAEGMVAEVRIQVNISRQAQGTDPRWRGAIEPTSVSAWFRGYSELCVELARLAAEEDVEWFGIGVELNSMQKNDERWREVAEAVRQVFSGGVTFAEATHLYLAGFNTYSEEPSFELNVGRFWDALDFIEMNMWPGLEGVTLETQADQRFSVVTENLVRFWRPAFEYYRAKYAALPVCFGEMGTFDYDGAIVTDDFFGAWQLPGARMDHQEFADTWAAYLCLAAAMGADGLAAWSVTLDPTTPQWVGTHKINMTPAIRVFRAVVAGRP